MKPDIGLPDKDRGKVAQILDILLSDEYVLYTKTRNYHWNVTGPFFNDLHKFFESQYEALDEIIDEVAERARALGEFSLGSLADFSKHARIKEKSRHPQPSANEMIKNLLEDHEAIIRSLRKDLDTCGNEYKDMGTSDFLTGLMEQHEKMAWMLRSLLHGK